MFVVRLAQSLLLFIFKSAGTDQEESKKKPILLIIRCFCGGTGGDLHRFSAYYYSE